MAWTMQQLGNWALSNFLWELLWLLFILIFLRFFPGIFRAFNISRKILKNNRETFGNGYGRHTADRFMNIWYANPKKPFSYKEIRRICITTNNGSIESRNVENDDELKKFGLVIVDDTNGQKSVRPVFNWKNRLVAMLVKFYLVHITGDSLKYYKDLEDQSKK